MNRRITQLETRLVKLPSSASDQQRMASVVGAMAARFDLAGKLTAEPGLADILEELAGRLVDCYPDLRRIAGQRILDIACGSSTSRSPARFHLRTPWGRKPVRSNAADGFAAVFEPWFCRILEALGAEPVGVDRGDLSGETFEHYRVDLGAPRALEFLPDHSFDGVQDSRLFGSPEFRAQFPNEADRLVVAREIVAQEARVLKPGGRVIHSDARALLR